MLGSNALHDGVVQPLLAAAAANNSGMLQLATLGIVIGSSFLLEARSIPFAAISLSVSIGLTMTGAVLGFIDHAAKQKPAADDNSAAAHPPRALWSV